MEGFLDQVKRVESSDGIPDGEYQGTWSGTAVKFETPHGDYEGNSTVGVRGMNVPCTVKVKCGQFKVVLRDISKPCIGCGRHKPYCDCDPSCYE